MRENYPPNCVVILYAVGKVYGYEAETKGMSPVERLTGYRPKLADRDKIVGLALFTTLMAATFLSVAAQDQLRSAKLERIAPGVWFRDGSALSHGRHRRDEMPVEIEPSNSVIIEMKDYLIVVDAGYPSDARLLMQAAKTVSPKPIKYALVTHHHGDHSYGNAEWTKADVTTVGHIGVGVEMLRHEPALRQNVSRWRKDVADRASAAPELPLRIFERSPFVLDDGQRRVEMHFFGWAHTRGDSFIFLPKEKIICTGDALVNGTFNYLGHGSIRNWNNVLAKAKSLGAERVLPGHGRPGGTELFAGQMRFLTELQTAVQKEIKFGRKLEELIFPNRKRGLAPSEGNLQTTIRLPASVRRWVSPDRLPEQVSDVYRQLAGVIAPPEPVSFATEDGGTTYGDLYGKGERGVVLAHGGRFNKESWERQARTLAEAGYHVLAIDLRGRGQTRAGTRTDRSDEGRRFDVLAAVRYLRKTGAKNVSVIGGSLGGEAVSEAAVEATPGEIDCVVLLGSEAGDKPEQMKGRKLFILCRDDKSGSGPRLPAIREHYERSPDPKELVILDCSAHAQFIFATEQGERLMREILRFLSDP